jgi:MFS family permease
MTKTLVLNGRRVTIGLYFAASFLYWMALYLYVPTLPVYVQSKSASLALVGLVLSQYGLWQAIIRLPLGIAADWLGWRKPFIVAGFILAGLGAWTMGVAGDAHGLLVGRAITGLAAGTWVPLVALFSGLFPPEEAVRASALLTLSSSLGRTLATLPTGSLNGLGGYSLAFFVAAGVAALAILIALPVPEQRRPPRPPAPRQIGRLIVRRDVLLPALLQAVSQYVNWAATFAFLPILARQLGATDVLQSVLVSLNIGDGIAPGRVRGRHVWRPLAERSPGRCPGPPADVWPDRARLPGTGPVRHPLAGWEEESMTAKGRFGKSCRAWYTASC